MQNSQISLATNNSGKKKEIQEILSPFSIQVLTPEELEIVFGPEETELTFEGNAFLKAREMQKLTGLPSLADDSGISVEALNGKPGVFSARYGGEGKTDQDRAILLLEELKGVKNREAKYTCAIAYVDKEKEVVFLGEVFGEIAMDYDFEGKFGFGYDPIFFYPPFGARFSRVPAEKKNLISHRRLALDKFLTWFSDYSLRT